jgi:hypothetical protein
LYRYVKAEGELSKEDKKAARAKRKRKGKASGLEKERVKTKRGRLTEAKEVAAEEAGFTRKVGGCTSSRIQLTHSLKPPGFNP